jgi:nitric oxide reductase subunit B
MDKLRWLRVIGDTLFAIGAVLLTIFVARLATGGSYRRGTTQARAHEARAPAE